MGDRQAGAVSEFWSELKRRKVVKTTIAYVIGAWVLIEVSATVFPALLLPDWTVRMVVVSALAGLPVVIILAWMFDIRRGAAETAGDAELEGTSSDTGGFGLVPPALDSAIASVAVLPFENLSADEEYKYLADGVATELHSALAKVHRLRVISRSSSFAIAKNQSDIKTIAEELGARFAISGSVRCDDGQMRVTVELDNAMEGIQIWSETYDRKLDCLFDVQREIANAVVSEFGGARLRDEIEIASSIPTDSMDAWTLVQRARSYVLAFTPRALKDAVPILRKAISLDASYAIAHAALASVLAELVLNGFSEDEETDSTAALDSADCAYALAPFDPFVLKMCGAAWAYFGRTGDAVNAIRQAVHIAPFDFGAWGYLGWPLVETGKSNDLVTVHETMQRLLETSPGHPGVPYWLYHRSVAFTCEGNHALAAEFGKKAVDSNPAFPWGWMQYANALGQSGDLDAARNSLVRGAGLSPSMTPLYYEQVIRRMYRGAGNAEFAELRIAGVRNCQ